MFDCSSGSTLASVVPLTRLTSDTTLGGLAVSITRVLWQPVATRILIEKTIDNSHWLPDLKIAKIIDDASALGLFAQYF